MTDPRPMIAAIRNSFPGAKTVYTRGGCWEFYLILKSVFPDAVPYYDHCLGHVYTKIGDHFYDIDGRLNKSLDLSTMLDDKRLMSQVHRWMPNANFRVVRLMDEDLT